MKLRSLSANHALLIEALDSAARGESSWSAPQWIPFLVPQFAFGAFEGDQLLAFAVFQDLVNEAELLFVTVDARARRKNLARTLLNHALASLREQGCACVHLEVSAENSAAQHLYTSLGFTTSGRRTRYYRDGSDAILMRREL